MWEVGGPTFQQGGVVDFSRASANVRINRVLLNIAPPQALGKVLWHPQSSGYTSRFGGGGPAFA
jgi:hypothetical protein